MTTPSHADRAHMERTARCHGCGAAIIWRYTPAGKNMPLDAAVTSEPARGTYVITSAEDCRPAEPMFDPPGTEFHFNHWASCPNAQEF